MKKISWRTTDNGKDGNAFKEYEKITYSCKADDAWVETELSADE